MRSLWKAEKSIVMDYYEQLQGGSGYVFHTYLQGTSSTLYAQLGFST